MMDANERKKQIEGVIRRHLYIKEGSEKHNDKIMLDYWMPIAEEFVAIGERSHPPSPESELVEAAKELVDTAYVVGRNRHRVDSSKFERLQGALARLSRKDSLR